MSGKPLDELKEEKTPLERETNRLVMIMAAIGCAVSLCVFLYYGFKRHEWAEGALAAITRSSPWCSRCSSRWARGVSRRATS